MENCRLFAFLPENQGQSAARCARRILLTEWDSLLSFRLAWRTLSSKLKASNLQGLKIRDRCFLISIFDGVNRSVLVTLFVSWPKTASAHVAQLVEHVLGKDEVTGSIPVMGSMSRNYPDILQFCSKEMSSKSIRRP